MKNISKKRKYNTLEIKIRDTLKKREREEMNNF
jgi:hypothetical protein